MKNTASLEDIKLCYLAGWSITETAARLGLTFTQTRTRIRRLGIMRPSGYHGPRRTQGGLTIGEKVRTATGRVGVVAGFVGPHVKVTLDLATPTIVTYRRRDVSPLPRPPQGERDQKEER